MLKLLFLFLVIFNAVQADSNSPFETTKDLPVAYQGRFRSLESASRLWLYDTYHQQQLKKNNLSAFHTEDPSALTLLWKVHFLGRNDWNDSPFFWIHYASLKHLLSLNSHTDRFSFKTLDTALENLKLHAPSAKTNLAKNASGELEELEHQMQVFTSYAGSSDQFQKPFTDYLTELQKRGMTTNEIGLALEARFPFTHRLQTAGTTLKMLPAKFSPGEWVSLQAFKLKVYDIQKKELVASNNFTSFSNSNFNELRRAYLSLEMVIIEQGSSEAIQASAINFADQYNIAYASLADKPYRQAQGKALTYPSSTRLQAETLYYRLPLIEITLMTYALALILMLANRRHSKLGRMTWLVLLSGFAVHTTVLILRCYILERPPVSNMFETVVYVPWIAVALGLSFYSATRSRLTIAAAVVASFALLVLLRLTQVDSRLENVQAVLDSQYWLIIHVLMIVASYGAFAVCGILGHFYLIEYALSKRNSPSPANSLEVQDRLAKIARFTLHTMYVGVALLIPGTILGGVWAAESWGRFWDWDPKESWAFISACVYLLVIHAYTFHHILDFGLAIGSITGLIAISFTWYGVNYVLGTGLHSYGFGSGGEFYYYMYVAVECLIIFLMVLLKSNTTNSLKKIE